MLLFGSSFPVLVRLSSGFVTVDPCRDFLSSTLCCSEKIGSSEYGNTFSLIFVDLLRAQNCHKCGSCLFCK